jgi:hypothetical protein
LILGIKILCKAGSDEFQGEQMIEALGLSEAGLRRIIATNAPGHLKLRDFDHDLEIYGRYLGRGATVKRAKFAKKSEKVKRRNRDADRPSLLKHVEGEIHSLLCTNSRRYAAIRREAARKGQHSQTVIVSSIAAIVTSTFNTTLGLAVSLVAVCLLAACKVGVNAYCRYYEKTKRLPPSRPK